MSIAINIQDLERVIAQIVHAADPDSILLFGSQARGNATPKSDVDIALIFPSKEQIQPGLRCAHRALWPRPFPLDLVGFAKETFQQGQTALAREVKEQGQTLYTKNECRR